MQYTGLDRPATQIRLLAIDFCAFRSSKAGLACNLLTFDLLKGTPPYSAISYAWGDICDRSRITIDNVQVLAPTQAVDALRYVLPEGIADGTGMVYFWIDAICIDQSNVQERSCQVAIMSKIYSVAEQVLVYLGAPFDGIVEAGSTIMHVVGNIRATNDTAAAVENALALYNEVEDTPLSDSATRALTELFSCRWFTRLWVIQEVALSRKAKVMIAGITVDFWDLVLMARWLTQLERQHATFRLRHTALTKGIEYCRTLYNIGYSGECIDDMDHDGQCIIGKCHPGLNLDWLLETSHCHQNSEPRDKVYAMLGLCKPRIADRIRPNYSEPLPSLFAQATKCAILESGQFAAMRWARTLGNKTTSWYEQNSWPSWVPLWHQSHHSGIHPSGLPAWAFTPADWGINGYRLVLRDELTISCTAVVIGQITSVSRLSLPLPVEDMTEVAAYVTQCVEQLLPVASSPATALDGKSSLTRLGLTLAAGYYSFADTEDNAGETHFGAFLRTTAKDHLCSSLSRVAQEKLSEGRGDPYKYLSQVQIHSRGRSVFFTGDGQIGLGLQHMQESDVICVPTGSPFPWILRSVRDHHVFVGQCYVYGVMEDYTDGVYDEAPKQLFEIH